jgi:hypothetical protein
MIEREFVTEAILGLLGIGLAIVAVAVDVENKIAWLLVAICILLSHLGVLHSSILSLLFFIGSRIEKVTDEAGEPPMLLPESQPSANHSGKATEMP